jgi:hypothetical protein
VAKVVVMMGRIGVRNEPTGVDAVNTAAMSDMVPEKGPRTSLSPQGGQPNQLCMSAYLPSLRFPHLPHHPMSLITPPHRSVRPPTPAVINGVPCALKPSFGAHSIYAAFLPGRPTTPTFRPRPCMYHAAGDHMISISTSRVRLIKRLSTI